MRLDLGTKKETCQPSDVKDLGLVHWLRCNITAIAAENQKKHDHPHQTDIDASLNSERLTARMPSMRSINVMQSTQVALHTYLQLNVIHSGFSPSTCGNSPRKHASLLHTKGIKNSVTTRSSELSLLVFCVRCKRNVVNLGFQGWCSGFITEENTSNLNM